MTVFEWIIAVPVGLFVLVNLYARVYSALADNPNIAFPYATVENKRSAKESVEAFGRMLDRAPPIAPGGHWVEYQDGTRIYHGPGGAEGRHARGDVDYDPETNTYHAHH